VWLHNKGAVGERSSFYAPLIYACNSERVVKICAELPKLSQKLNWVSTFWTTLYSVFSVQSYYVR